MKRQNTTIVAVVVFAGAVLLNYDSDNADRRERILSRSSSFRAAILSEQEMIERGNELRRKAEELLVETSRAREINEQGEELHRRALQKHEDISKKLVEMKAGLEKKIVEYNQLAEEYNRSTRNILFRTKDVPAEMSKYEQPDQAL